MWLHGGFLGRDRGGGLPVRRTAAALAGLRGAIGVVMLADPPRLARVLGVDRVTARQTGWLTRMTGAREVALAVGCLAAVRRREGVASWCAAQAIADVGDAVAVGLAVRQRVVQPGLGGLVVVSAAAGAVVAVVTARAVDRVE